MKVEIVNSERSCWGPLSRFTESRLFNLHLQIFLTLKRRIGQPRSFLVWASHLLICLKDEQIFPNYLDANFYLHYIFN